MKQNRVGLILHYGAVTLLAAYGVFATLEIRRMNRRLDSVESKLMHLYAPKPESVAASR